MNRLLAGAVAGCVATVPMTMTMYYLHRRLPSAQRYPLPPREITQTVLHETGLKRFLGRSGLTRASLAAHFAYGAATGALFGAFARAGNPAAERSTLRAASEGAVYGVGVWAVSYLGWIPAAGILKPATEHPQRRNYLMLTAHFVWGASTALVTRCFSSRSGRPAIPPQNRWVRKAPRDQSPDQPTSHPPAV